VGPGGAAKHLFPPSRRRDNLQRVYSALIIDADQEAAVAIQGALQPYGFDATMTADPSEAMASARSAVPDIIFLRVELPNVSGFSVCNKLRRSDDTKYIPLVMYASGVSEDVFNQHRNLKTHADEYLTLPLSTDVLTATVRALLELPEAAEAAPASELDVDVDDIEQQADAHAEQTSLGMDEFDDEFANLHEDGAPAGSALESEADAAIDALVDEIAVEAEELAEPEHDIEAQIEDAPPAAPPADEPPAYDPSAAASDPAADDDLEPASALDVADASESGTLNAQRQVIQLKAQLNAKNREILALKDELESQERGILDAKHKNRELQAQIGDLEEKILTAESEVLTAREQAQAAVRDKATILKREEGLKGRLEVTQKKVKDLEGEMEGLRVELSASREQQAGAAAVLQQAQGELAEARADTARTQESLAEAHARAEQTAAELERAHARIGELQESLGQAENDVAAARALAEVTRQEAEQELESRLAAAAEAAEAAKQHALQAQAEEHQAEIEFNESRQRERLERVRAPGRDRVPRRAELEKLRSQLAEAKESVRKRELELDAVTSELTSTKDGLGKRIDSLRERPGRAQRRAHLTGAQQLARRNDAAAEDALSRRSRSRSRSSTEPTT
jgi:CheY-like chemotaxis protein